MRWESLSLGYTEATGLGALRQEIARMYERIQPEHILVLSGAEEGIFLAMHAMLAPGDHAIVVTPAYQSLHAVARALGASLTLVPLQAAENWELDPERIAFAVTRATRLIAINFPHNPTGSQLTRDALQRISEIAQDAKAVLFSDEVYRGLEYRSEQMLPAATDLSESAVSLGVMSKAFALAGLRIGWLATRNASLMQRLVRLRDYTTICNSAPSEILALMALRARDQLLSRSREIVAANLEHARRFIEHQAPHVEWVRPKAGSVAFPRLVSRNADELSRELAEHESVLLMPGSVFGTDPSFFRLGLGRTDLPTALEKLSGALVRGPRND